MELVKDEEKESGEKEIEQKIKVFKMKRSTMRKFKKLKGRKIIYRKVFPSEVGKNYYEDHEAVFIEWGHSFDFNGDIPLQISTAICINDKGIVNSVPVQFVRFL